MALITIAESGLLPDSVIRLGIRRLLSKRLKKEDRGAEDVDSFADSLRCSPLAIETDAANRQHYEVPPRFYELVLGPRLKYSCCAFPTPHTTLAEAEDEMLRLTCERAELKDGMSVLELGCGWGSLTLWMADRFPNTRVVAVSNSNSQREFIESRVRARGHRNVRVITSDMRDFDTAERYDRVVSVEMLEHMRNYELLFRRVEGWLAPAGRAFVHVFCHARRPYLFESDGADNWMGRHFFSGGTMPSVGLFERFHEDLKIVRHWRHSGLHYWRTCEQWLANLDRSRGEVLDLFRREMAAREARVALQRWRMFFMACAELFRYRGGEEWFVAHYLFNSARGRRAATGSRAAASAGNS